MVNGPAFPSRDAMTIGFAPVAYRAAEEFAARRTGVAHFEVRTLEELERLADEADVLVVSGLWRNSLLTRAPRLRFVQSFSAGTDQYDKALFVKHGVRLANAQGANERAVAEHAIALILALTRQLHQAHDNQRARRWRGMIGDRALREQELGGKTLVIVGLGRIGMRLAVLARAFDMRVIGVRRTARPGPKVADQVVAQTDLPGALACADVVALTCPLTSETEDLIGVGALTALQPGASLRKVARGGGWTKGPGSPRWPVGGCGPPRSIAFRKSRCPPNPLSGRCRTCSLRRIRRGKTSATRRMSLTSSWTTSNACYAARPYCETRWCDGWPLS